MRKKILFWLFFILALFFILPGFKKVLAANLDFEPTSVSTDVGQTFEIKINVDSSGEQILSTDAVVLYDKDILSVQSIAEGTFFPTVTYDTSQEGQAYVAGMVDDPATWKEGSGTVATVVFSAIANGSTTLTFDCTPGETIDSNIAKNDLHATDIIECSANGTTDVVVGGGGEDDGGTTATPTSTPASGGTSGQLPQSGILDNVLKYSVPGIILLILGGLVKLTLL